MGNSLFAKKPMEWLMDEANAIPARTRLKRTLGPVSLTALGVGAIIGAGIFVMSGLGRALRGSGTDAFVRDIRAGLRVCGAVLRGVRGDDSAGGQRLHLCVCGAGGNFCVDYRLGPDARIRDGREHGFVGVVESLHRVPEDFSSAGCRCGWPTTIGRPCARRKTSSRGRWRTRRIPRWR